MIQATVAVYALGQADYTAVDEAIERLRATGVDVEVGSMHTQIGAMRRPSSPRSTQRSERPRRVAPS